MDGALPSSRGVPEWIKTVMRPLKTNVGVLRERLEGEDVLYLKCSLGRSQMKMEVCGA